MVITIFCRKCRNSVITMTISDLLSTSAIYPLSTIGIEFAIVNGDKFAHCRHLSGDRGDSLSIEMIQCRSTVGMGRKLIMVTAVTLKTESPLPPLSTTSSSGDLEDCFATRHPKMPNRYDPFDNIFN